MEFPVSEYLEAGGQREGTQFIFLKQKKNLVVLHKGNIFLQSVSG